MLSMSKQLWIFAGWCVLAGCATGSGQGEGPPATTRTAAATCMNRIDGERQQCEQQCPMASGNEHFSVQHKLAMENAACKERCAAASETQAMECKRRS